jgi:plastocyanin
MGEKESFNRRHVLLSSSVVATGGLAGCLGFGGGGGGDGGSDDDDDADQDDSDGDDSQYGGGTDTESNDVTEVELVSNAFEPQLAQLSEGDTVRFRCTDGSHTATLYHPDNDDKPLRAPDDAEGWDSETLESGDTFEVTLDEPGVYDYFCRPHEGQGMVGSLLVGDNDNPDQAGLSEPEDVADGATEEIGRLNRAARTILGLDADGGAGDAHDVAIVSNRFYPRLTSVAAGDTIRFTCAEGSHTATLYHGDNQTEQRAPEDAESWDSGTLDAGDTYETTLQEPGVYDYFCRPHQGNGMVGSVIVGDNADPQQAGLSEPGPDVPNAAGQALIELNDVARTILGVDDGGNEINEDDVTEVSVVSNSFDPELAEIETGESIRFVCEEGTHTATLYHPRNDRQVRAPADATPWHSGTLTPGASFTVTFDTAGVYDYFCQPHEDRGMVGSIIVGDNDDPGQSGLSEPQNVPVAAEGNLRNLNNQARNRLGIEGANTGNLVEIDMVSDEFQPEIKELAAGDTVRFNCIEGEHTATLYHPDNGEVRRAPTGAEAFDSGLLQQGESFDVTITTPGVYDYFSDPQEDQGMVGSLIVGDNADPNQAGLSDPVDVPQAAATALTDLNEQVRQRLGIGDGSGASGAPARLEVSVESTFFSPAIDRLQPGGTLEFSVEEGTHTATLYHPDNGENVPLRAPDGVEAWDSGTIDAGETFSVQLDEPGVYDYFCEFHQSLSMVGSVVVGTNDDPDQAGLSEPNDVAVQQAADRLRELNEEARTLLDDSSS